MSVYLNLTGMEGYLDKGELQAQRKKAGDICGRLFAKEDVDQVLGWRTLHTSAVQLELIKKKAEEIRRDGEVFVIVGVGGSNQAARAMIEALDQLGGPEIIYLGNTLSSYTISRKLEHMEGKNVYLAVIAKNFETLEPGSHFRILRQWMRKQYSGEELAQRITLIGTTGSRLEAIAKENNYLFLEFPAAVGGRYSAFTPVGLFPMAVAGLRVDEYLRGVGAAMEDCREHPEENPASGYGAARNLLYRKGYDIEMLVSFEPRYAYLEKWWVQLFGESEGKGKKGIFPAAAIYSEDLHSIGQYMQDGRRSLIETFLSVENPGGNVIIQPDPDFGDGFDYLDKMDFGRMNKAAEAATWSAHVKGGVPCIGLKVEEISERTFGELFYYFMMSCAVSGTLMGVNPFDQMGVEDYKHSLFAALGKDVSKV